jgi:hypothetical protein
MALTEIRETIETSVSLDGNGLGIVQKRINLQSGARHQIFQMDMFQDAIPETDSDNLIIEWFVTPYPVIYSTMKLTPLRDSRGPMAGDDKVLMKSIWTSYDLTKYGTFTDFPNQFLGAQPTFSFYTPALYVTGLVHGAPAASVTNLAFSFYVACENKKASLVSYGLGVLRERSIAQGINLMAQGRTIPPSGNVGQIFPMWKFGGIRPERMLRGNALADFFLPYSSTDSEKMLSTGNVRGYLSRGRTMQPFDAAFGSFDAVKGQIPDWVRFDLNPGLVSGPIRPQQPPRKLADNGNTLMF